MSATGVYGQAGDPNVREEVTRLNNGHWRTAVTVPIGGRAPDGPPQRISKGRHDVLPRMIALVTISKVSCLTLVLWRIRRGVEEEWRLVAFFSHPVKQYIALARPFATTQSCQRGKRTETRGRPLRQRMQATNQWRP